MVGLVLVSARGNQTPGQRRFRRPAIGISAVLGASAVYWRAFPAPAAAGSISDTIRATIGLGAP